MKKALVIIELLIVFLILYFLQSNFFSWYNILGIAPNLFIILILFIGLFMGKAYGFVLGIFLGIILDFFIGVKIGINAITMGIIGGFGAILDKNFSKDSRMTLMFMVFSSTIIFELIFYILQILICNMQIEILPFLKILNVEVIYNLIITIIIYPGFQKFGNYVENVFTEDKGFIKYF